MPAFRRPLLSFFSPLFAVTLLSAPATATAPAEDVTFQLSRTLKKPDVVYVLTRDSEARHLGLSDADWEMFMTGHLAADPPQRATEEGPLFHQAFDPSTTLSADLLPGFAVLNTISEVDQVPRGQLVEVLVREPEKYQSEMKLAAESIETIMEGGIFSGLYGILKERTLDQFKEDLAHHSLNSLYGAYRDARLSQHMSPEQAFSAVQEMGTGLSQQGGPRFKLEWQWAWGNFHDLGEKFGLTVDAAHVDRAMREYFEMRFKKSAYENVTMEQVVEDLVRVQLAKTKSKVVHELNYRVKQRLHPWQLQIREWGNRAAELANYPNCKYNEAAQLAEKIKRASPHHPWLQANERLIVDSRKDAAVSQQRLRDARTALSQGYFAQARVLLESVKQDGTACDLVTAESELDKVKDAERAAAARQASPRSSSQQSAASQGPEDQRAVERATGSVVIGAAAPPPPTRQEPAAAQPGDSPACRQIRQQGCLTIFPGMERFAYFVVVQLGPADAGGCVQVSFYPGMTPDQARQTANAALQYSSRTPVPMRAVYGPASYQSAMDYARRLCREKSGTEKVMQPQMR
jgi:hypothetical protein